jgi:MazG family protein
MPRVSSIDRLIQIMAQLRDPEHGCPWDVEQDFASIAPYTIEEAYEVEDAIRRGDRADLQDELGDLLLQVVFHARMAEEEGSFGFEQVVESICDKLVRRHPNVFAGQRLPDPGVQPAADVQLDAWEAHKRRERAERARDEGREPSVLDGIPLGLPALMRARKYLARARRAGFRWREISQALDKLEEEVAELRQAVHAGDAAALEHELGDVLFAAAGVGEDTGTDPEAAVRGALARFESRLRHVERAARARNQTLEQIPNDELLELWRHAKREAG